MILITGIMFLAAVFGGIPTVAKSPECLIISRALAGLHCGKWALFVRSFDHALDI